MKTIDETGKRYGRLTVEGPAPPLRILAGTHALWLCRCDCGAGLVVTGSNLRRGKVRSCGCLRRDTAASNLPHNRKKKETAT